MKRPCRIAAMGCLASLLAASLGCSQTSKAGVGDASAGDASVVALCTDCGQIKGSAACCQPGQTACTKCGLVKGSPGCCKIVAGSDQPAYLCTKCGFLKGSADCCKPGQPTCAKCGLVKGSPGCCKLPQAG